MPIKKSAKKAIRQDVKKKAKNVARKIEMKAVVKEIRLLANQDKKDDAKKLLSRAYKAIDKAAKIGLIKSNSASRKKSRITKSLTK
ncbi:MAG: 30S ribosomal protein S20 [Candidatus Nealsonbacteria bacterium]|nr:30S ribosomal protein S20 [Candidatus Nealsonbacteria bacterium]